MLLIVLIASVKVFFLKKTKGEKQEKEKKKKETLEKEEKGEKEKQKTKKEEKGKRKRKKGEKRKNGSPIIFIRQRQEVRQVINLHKNHIFLPKLARFVNNSKYYCSR